MSTQAVRVVGRAIVAAGLVAAACPPLRAADDRNPAPRVPHLESGEAWRRLPAAEAPSADPLPGWARALAGPLPHTTAAMLELDSIYRTSDELDPALRARLRWVAAHANRSAYGEAYGVADMRRAGMTARDVESFLSGPKSASDAEAAAISFVRKLTLRAYTITDGEFARLVEHFGERAAVGIVLQTAYANFLDRIVLALGTAVESGGPLPPLAVRFEPVTSDQSIAAPRPELPKRPVPKVALTPATPAWSDFTFEQLQTQLQQQRQRPARISVPEWEDIHPNLPPGLYPADRPMRVKWSLVVLGHQPKLGAAWLRCLRTFSRESDADRVFKESLFWVVTRSLQCFY